MASLAYSDNLSKVVKCTSGTPKCVPKGYNTLIHQVQAKGQATFQGVAALNPRTRDLIIAYRGTWTAGGVQDIGLFKSAVSSTGASCLRYAIKTASGKACKDNSVSCWGKYVTGIPCRAASQVDGISRLPTRSQRPTSFIETQSERPVLGLATSISPGTPSVVI